MAKSNGILAMNPEQYREIDGVVFDLDSGLLSIGYLLLL